MYLRSATIQKQRHFICTRKRNEKIRYFGEELGLGLAEIAWEEIEERDNTDIGIDITSDMVENAIDRANDIGHLNNSITSGQGNLAGIIGEDIVKDYIGGSIDNTYDYDVVKDDVLYDVKTKRCTSKPRDYYECSVAAFNTKQKCDKYIFVRVLYTNTQYTTAWIRGE